MPTKMDGITRYNLHRTIMPMDKLLVC